MGRPLKYNLAGKVFGRWTVLERVGNNWLCVCKCGVKKEVYGGTLRGGLSRSCGCYNRAVAHAKRVDLTGRRVGLLTVLEETAPGRWLCDCDCGNKIEALHRSILKGWRRSCGCLKTAPEQSLHRTYSDMYGTWAGMIQRCHNPKNKSYKNYGGRGVYVCDEWRSSFERFFADVGERPFGMTLDRIDVNGSYRADNCRWATFKQQSENRRKATQIENFSTAEMLAELAKRS